MTPHRLTAYYDEVYAVTIHWGGGWEKERDRKNKRRKKVGERLHANVDREEGCVGPPESLQHLKK